MFKKHEERIRNTYKLKEGELNLIAVEAKVGQYEGVYYRMTLEDDSHKRYNVKIEIPKPQDSL